MRAFDPASAPATRKSVFAETDPDTFAPSDSARALASARDMPERVPVKTTVLPLTGLSSDGLPLGVQLLGRPFDEVGLLRVAQALEDAAGFTATPQLMA